jgi:hypothetical protein
LEAWRTSDREAEAHETHANGIYTAYEYDLPVSGGRADGEADGEAKGGAKGGRVQGRVQLLLLDTRWNRTPLEGDPMSGGCVPSTGEGATIIGEAQFAWLADRLARAGHGDFVVTIVASPTQVLRQSNGQESWANFPADQARLVDLIGTYGLASCTF